MKNKNSLLRAVPAVIAGFAALISLAGHGLEPMAMWTCVLAYGYSAWHLIGWALKD